MLQSVRPYSTLNRKRKTVQRSNVDERLRTSGVTSRTILRSQGQSSRSLGAENGEQFDAHLLATFSVAQRCNEEE